MPIRSHLVYLSAVLVGTAFLMLSCASSSQPDQLKIHVPQNLTGPIHIDTCVSGAPAGDVILDDQGIGKTSLCPATDHTVEIEVITAGKRYKIAAQDVRVQRAGDGIPTSIEAQLR